MKEFLTDLILSIIYFNELIFHVIRKNIIYELKNWITTSRFVE